MTKCVFCNSNEAFVIGGISICDKCTPKAVIVGIILIIIGVIALKIF